MWVVLFTLPELTPFHLAIAVHDINQARHFYSEVLGFPQGRSSDNWVDFNCFGHQLVAHLDKKIGTKAFTPSLSNNVDNDDVPVPHFGVVMEMSEWELFCERLIQNKIKFIIPPRIRFQGKPGEQATVFFFDPSGNVLEFKAFKNIHEQLFATSPDSQ